MTWTTFGSTPNPTGQELDTNLLTLARMGAFPCTVGGSANAITLTPTDTNAPPNNAYANYQEYGFVAGATNNSAVTIKVGTLPTLNAYKDTPSGPIALASGEIVQNCAYIAMYDLALNGGTGGFHILSAAVVNNTQISPNQISFSGSGSTLTNLNSAIFTTVGYTVVPANSVQEAQINTGLSNGLQVGDAVIARYFAGIPANAIFMDPYVKAPNTIALRMANPTGASIAAFTVTVGFIGLRAVP